MVEFRNEPRLVDLDASAIVDSVADAAGEDVRTIVEYDEEEYNFLFVADGVVEQLGGEDEIHGLAEELHGDFRLDFTQQELYEEIYGKLGSVQAFVVVMQGATVIRVVGEDTGLYISLQPGASVQRVLDAVESEVDRGE